MGKNHGSIGRIEVRHQIVSIFIVRILSTRTEEPIHGICHQVITN